jgi:uncharacterized membrane protein
MNQLSLPSRQRIDSLDILRGSVMIIMALDHVRDYFHADAFVHDPLDLATTSPFLFFTRFITHFCAPVFVFLAGISAFLQSERKTKKQLSSLLIKRGLWLILVELAVVTLGWTFDPGYHLLIFQVIWAIGFSMIGLGLLIHLPLPLLLVIGIIITFGHNLLDFTSIMQQKQSSFLFDLLWRGNFAIHPITEGRAAIFIYAGIPWMGVMLLGYCFGVIYRSDIGKERRRRMLLLTSFSLLLFFVALRIFNVYGDPHQWGIQGTALFTFLSFINVTKYPPSLLFLCLMIGPVLLLLVVLENANNSITRVITVYGGVPFFFYVAHIFLIHAFEMLFYLQRGHAFSEGMKGNKLNPFLFTQPGEGFNLAGVYLVWILVVAALYFPCKWFNDYKSRKRTWWMSYL